MAQLKLYRVWHKDGSCRLVNQSGHREAAEEAQELAHLQNADMPGRETWGKQAYLDACRVVLTECITPGCESKQKWKAR